MRLKENIYEFQKSIIEHKRLFIIGTGSSLKEIPLDIFNKLKDEFTIGINFSYKVFNPNCIIWGDQKATDYIYNDNIYFNPVFIMRNNAFNELEYKNIFEFQVWLDSVINYKFDETHYTGHLTSSWLLQILGNYYGKIYLLGFDFYPGHCYTEEEIGFDPNDGWISKNFDKAIDQHKGFKMNIFNCNPKSKLKEYPFTDISEILKEA